MPKCPYGHNLPRDSGFQSWQGWEELPKLLPTLSWLCFRHAPEPEDTTALMGHKSNVGHLRTMERGGCGCHSLVLSLASWNKGMVLEKAHNQFIVQHKHNRFKAPGAWWQHREGSVHDCSTLMEGNPTPLPLHTKKSS